MKVTPSVFAESEERDITLYYTRPIISSGNIPIDKVEGLQDVITNLYECIETHDERLNVLMQSIASNYKKMAKMEVMLKELYYPYRTEEN